MKSLDPGSTLDPKKGNLDDYGSEVMDNILKPKPKTELDIHIATIVLGEGGPIIIQTAMGMIP